MRYLQNNAISIYLECACTLSQCAAVHWSAARPSKTVQGDLGLADIHIQCQPLNCTPEILYKTNRQSEKHKTHKNFWNTLVPDDGTPPGVRGSMCALVPTKIDNLHLVVPAPKQEACQAPLPIPQWWPPIGQGEQSSYSPAGYNTGKKNSNYLLPIAEKSCTKKTENPAQRLVFIKTTQTGIAAKWKQICMWADPQGRNLYTNVQSCFRPSGHLMCRTSVISLNFRASRAGVGAWLGLQGGLGLPCLLECPPFSS